MLRIPALRSPTGFDARAILVVFGVALVLRMAWLFYCRPVPVSDFAQYYSLAQGLVEHGQYGYPDPTASRPPGFPMFLAGLMVVSDSPLWLGFGNVLLSSGITVLVGLLAALLFSRADISVAAALTCALHPSFIAFSPVLGTEHLFTFLVLAATITPVSRDPTRLSTAVFSGVLLGLAVHVRPEAVAYGPVLCGLFLAAPNPWRAKIATLGVLGLVTLLIVAPWYIRNERVVGRGAGLGTNGGVTFYQGHNPDIYGYHEPTWMKGLDEVTVSKEGYRRGLEYIRRKPLSVLRSTALGTMGLYVPDGGFVEWSTRLPRNSDGTWPSKDLALRRPMKALDIGAHTVVLVCALLSLISFRSWPRRAWRIVWGLVAAHWLLYAVVYWGAPRYLFLPETLWCIPVGIVLLTVVRHSAWVRQPLARDG